MTDPCLAQQCKNMLCVTSAFLTACSLALADVLSAQEERALKKIKAAAGHFQAELTKLIAERGN